MSKEGDLTEEDGRGEEGNTLMHRMYIHKLIKVNYYAEHEKKGRRKEWGENWGGGLNECCVHAGLQCTNK